MGDESTPGTPPSGGQPGGEFAEAKVLVRRAIPTEPAVRGSESLFMAEAVGQGLRPSRRMLYVGPERVGGDVATALGVEQGARVIARRKMMLADGVPVRIATSYLRLDLFGGSRLLDPGFLRPSLQAVIEESGHRFGHAEEYLVARTPTEFEAETLQLDPGEWVVRILRAAYSEDGTPVHILETVCAASRHVFPVAQVTGADEF